MDFIEAKHSAAREIALAFGVPPMLLGLPGDNTYANYAEANRSFWRQTVLPLVGRTSQSLAAWLAPDAPALRLMPDLDRIDALADEREALWRRIGAADFLTDDEKREAVGYGARGGTGVKYSPDQPRVPPGSSGGGQWTGGGGGGGARVAQLGGATLSDAQPAEADSVIALVGGSRNDDLSASFDVNLADDELSGQGHTIKIHVAKTDEFLTRLVRLRQSDGQELYLSHRILPTDGVRVGTFPSLGAANKLVNSTLSSSVETVRQVASGLKTQAFLTKHYPSPTGKEAYAPSLWGSIFIQETFGVGVFIRHDPASPKGFRVHTAYPIR